MTKGSFSKYLIYAIGEILFVVIGILIALYLNDKKDISDRQEKQKNHLVLIKEELENNLIILEKEDKDLSNIIDSIKDLINLESSNNLEEEISELELSEILFLPLTRGIAIDYENGAFNEFSVSGSLKDIKNDSLRSFLRSWHRKLEILKLQEEVVRQSLDKSNDFIETHGALKTIFDTTDLPETYLEINKSSITSDNKHILNSRQFENILIKYLGVATQLHKKPYQKFKNDIYILLRLIDDEITK